MLELCKEIPPEKVNGFNLRYDAAYRLATIMYPEFMCDLETNHNSDKANYKQMWLIDLVDVLVILKNFNNINVIVEHFSKII